MRNLIWKTGGVLLLPFVFAACDDSVSYAELLEEESKAVNSFLSDKQVRSLPADTVFTEFGEDSPYYRLDEDGNVFMQVLDPGDLSDKVVAGETVYFRFERYDLKSLMSGKETLPDTNMDDPVTETYFVFQNYRLPSSASYGTGIQMPLEYLGRNCSVNLVVRAKAGFTSEMSYVIPYLYRPIKYLESY